MTPLRTLSEVQKEFEKELESFTHYYRSKFSQDCSRNETEEEKNTEMLEKKDVKTLKQLIFSSLKQLLEQVLPKEYVTGEDDDQYSVSQGYDWCRKEVEERIKQIVK